MPSKRYWLVLVLVLLVAGAGWTWWGRWPGSSTVSAGKLLDRARGSDVPTALDALRELSLQRRAEDRPALEQLARHAPDPAVRGGAAAALGLLPDADVALLTELARSPGPPALRAGATLGLRRTCRPGSAQVLPVLLELLSDPQREVRLHAIKGLTNITVTTFPDYKADLPPDDPSQQAAVSLIRRFLTENGLLP